MFCTVHCEVLAGYVYFCDPRCFGREKVWGIGGTYAERAGQFGLQVYCQRLQGSFRATPPLTPVRVNRVEQGWWVLVDEGVGESSESSGWGTSCGSRRAMISTPVVELA